METFLSLDSVSLCVPAIPSRNAPGADDQEGEFYCVVTDRRCGRSPLRHRPCLAQTPQKGVAPAAAIQVDIAACSVSQCEAPIRRNEGTSLTFAAGFAAGEFHRRLGRLHQSVRAGVCTRRTQDHPCFLCPVAKLPMCSRCCLFYRSRRRGTVIRLPRRPILASLGS